MARATVLRIYWGLSSQFDNRSIIYSLQVEWTDISQHVNKTDPKEVDYHCPTQPPQHKKRCFLPGEEKNPEGEPSPLSNDLLKNLDTKPGPKPGEVVIAEILPKGAEIGAGLNVDGLWVKNSTGEVEYKPLVDGDPFKVL